MRNDTLIRVLRLMSHLKAQRSTLNELAREFQVTARTIRRDLEALSLVGMPIRQGFDEDERGRGGFYWMES